MYLRHLSKLTLRMSSNTPIIRSYLTEEERCFLAYQIHHLTGDDPNIEQVESNDENWEADASNSSGLIAMPLSKLPFEMPNGWVKSTLVKRSVPGYSIKLFDDANNIPLVKRLRGDLKIYFNSAEIRDQCLHQFPNWTPVEDRKDADAEIARTSDKEKSEDLTYFDFDPIEIIPRPASGIICLVCRKDDTQTKRWARQLMDRETGMCSNLERELLQIQTVQRPEAELFAFSRKTNSGYETAVSLNVDDKWVRTLETTSSTAGAAQLLWNDLVSKLD